MNEAHGGLYPTPTCFQWWQRVWKYWHTKQRAALKAQESPWEDTGREGEVDPWNALRRVSHLFTSWTRWTMPDSATSTQASLAYLSLPLVPLFCSLPRPEAPHLLAPPFHLLIDRHVTFMPLIGRILNLCLQQPNPAPTQPQSPRCSPWAAGDEVMSSWRVAKQMSVGSCNAMK